MFILALARFAVKKKSLAFFFNQRGLKKKLSFFFLGWFEPTLGSASQKVRAEEGKTQKGKQGIIIGNKDIVKELKQWSQSAGNIFYYYIDNLKKKEQLFFFTPLVCRQRKLKTKREKV